MYEIYILESIEMMSVAYSYGYTVLEKRLIKTEL